MGSWFFENVLLSSHFLQHTHTPQILLYQAQFLIEMLCWPSTRKGETLQNHNEGIIVPMLWEDFPPLSSYLPHLEVHSGSRQEGQELSLSEGNLWSPGTPPWLGFPKWKEKKKSETATDRWLKGRSYTSSAFVHTVKMCLLQGLGSETFFIPQGWSTCEPNERSRALFLLGWTSLCRTETA